MAVPIPEGSSAAPQEDTRATAACDLEVANATPPADMRAISMADPEGAPARSLSRARTRRRRPTLRARPRGPLGGTRNGGTLILGYAGAAPQADTRAMVSFDPECAPARPLRRRTHARRRRRTPRARHRGPSGGRAPVSGARPRRAPARSLSRTGATTSFYPEYAPARPLMRKRARRRRSFSRARHRSPSGRHASDGGARTTPNNFG